VEKTLDGKFDVKFLEVIQKDVKDPHHGSCPLKG
jgi:hypothetical protein